MRTPRCFRQWLSAYLGKARLPCGALDELGDAFRFLADKVEHVRQPGGIGVLPSDPDFAVEIGQ